jgi:acetoacetate decarboxylase
MTYPATPWTLCGCAFISFYGLKISTVRPFIPPELEILSFFRHYTLGGIYIASYGTNSVLEYNELIIAPACVRYQNHIGVWVSHIYVDNENSLRGGREIWGLPKEMANFAWQNGTIIISQQNHIICNFSSQSALLPLPTFWTPNLTLPCFSHLEGDWLSFQAKFRASIGIVVSKTEITSNSPFYHLKIDKSFLTLHLNNLELTVPSPQIIT